MVVDLRENKELKKRKFIRHDKGLQLGKRNEDGCEGILFINISNKVQL